ncbi:GntR family transcriptional regulator [Enteractinococcus fodinae]|uniref:DNA-binding GntR family transcriptional regulator n=1 Tax=Enteractinococcus fodinae TaxID=684663 RepID=A0ABU2AX16_9MICC|nr:GntR family transcriptional regulator [Enteractinococcus fodinae]MDR7345893.1 DNA-binding GntR family transcriptional regulator [Enteractinococcus fodinae]
MAKTGNSTSAAERAYQVIRERILDGTHLPGTMLGENALATDLGVSRTPIRVALARLQDEGWIVIYPKRGALVQGMSERTIAELAEARVLLETTAVDRASTQLRHRLADRLDRSIAEQREALTRGDLRGFIDLTLEFHRGFVEAGGNTVLLELYAQLSDRHRFVLFAAGDRLLNRGAEIIAEHVQLTEYLRTGDADAFAKTLRVHITENAPPAALGRDSTEFITA